MKILQVSHGLPPKEIAGVELYTFHLSNALTRLHHQVHVFCRDSDPKREEYSLVEDQIDALRVTRAINNLKNARDIRDYYENSHFDRPFTDVLERERPDLVHFQHLFGLSAGLIKIAKKAGYPVVVTLHDFFFLCHRIHLLKEDQQVCSGPLYGVECASCLGYALHPGDTGTKLLLGMRGRVPFGVIKWAHGFLISSRYLGDRGYEAFHRFRYISEMVKEADLLLAPSRFVRGTFVKHYPFVHSRTRVLPLGIPPIKENGSSAGPARELHGKIRFCYYGNVLALKGLHVLIEALRGIPEEKYEVSIYGTRTPWNYSYYDLLREKASGLPVHFYGAFDRDRLTEILGHQDVVILPSICYESFSFVIREALQLGLPVIASKIGAIPEAVEEGVNGFLFKPGDPEDLRRRMRRFIENPGLVQFMGSKKKPAKSMAEHAAELVDLYQEVIQASGHRP